LGRNGDSVLFRGFFMFIPYLIPLSDFSRPIETPALDSGITDTLHDSPLLTYPGNLIESNHESTSSLADTTVDKITSDSRALVPVPASTEALAVVPVSQKIKRSEFVQRRTRRPFSVAEVEALVHAVEELGTGRYDVINNISLPVDRLQNWLANNVYVMQVA